MTEFDSMKFSKIEKEIIEELMQDPKFPYNNISLYLLLASEAYRNEFNSVKSNKLKRGKWIAKQRRRIEHLKRKDKVHQDARISWKETDEKVKG